MSERNKIVYSNWTFTDESIQNGSVYLAMSLLSDSLEANTFSASVICNDKSILDFERNTPLTYFSRGRQVGIFYVQSITRTGPISYDISATSAVGLMIEGIHYGGIYNGEAAKTVIADICGTIPYIIKSDLQDIAIYGWLPIASPRDNLSQVLFAIGACVKTDYDGVLHIETLWDGTAGEFPSSRMYQGPSVDYAAKVTEVIVTEHQYSEGGDDISLFEGSTQEGDVITFDEPVYGLQAQGFTILESGANYAKLSTGSGTLTGTKYLHRTRQVTRTVSSANEPNVKTVTDATLVSVLNSAAVAERLVAYYQCLETINADAVYQGEAPGELLTTWHPYDLESVSACLENADVNLSNTLKATETLLVGYVPPKDEQVIIYDQKEILTGSGTWIVPDGVHSAHVVLIGGGGVGENGANGRGAGVRSDRDYDNRAFTFTGSVSQTVNVSASCNSNAQTGQGGAGGASGVPGNVLELDIDLTAGDTISYTCGVKGSVSGQSGGATTFGEYTSANGGIMESGYTDLTTGIVYAKRGVDGVSGGDGGSPGQPGESVATAVGGAASRSYSDSDSGTVSDDDELWTISSNYNLSYNIGSAGGGGAGGGTNDNPGGDGSTATISQQAYFYYNIQQARVDAPSIRGANGGQGAPGKDANTYGSSGDGGHGGGGGGGIAAQSVQASLNASITRKRTDPTEIQYFNADARIVGGSSSGGAGGAGGQGADGCIIIFYGVESVVQTGPVQTSDGKTIIDKYGRLYVV